MMTALIAAHHTDPPDPPNGSSEGNPDNRSDDTDGPETLTYNGETRTLWEWAQVTGISYQKLYQRVRKLKWPPEEALKKHRRLNRPRPRPHNARIVVAGEGETFTHNGETRTIIEWARIVGIRPDKLYRRIKKLGWSLDDALKPQRRRRPAHTLRWMTAETPDGTVTKPMSEWAAERGIPMSTISRRLGRGWTDTQALEFAPSPREQQRLDSIALAEQEALDPFQQGSLTDQNHDPDPFRILDFPDED